MGFPGDNSVQYEDLYCSFFCVNFFFIFSYLLCSRKGLMHLIGLLAMFIRSKKFGRFLSIKHLWEIFEYHLLCGHVICIIHSSTREAELVGNMCLGVGLGVGVSHSVMFDCLQPYGLKPTRPLCPRNFPGKNIGVSSHSLLQRILLTQGLNPGLLYRQTHTHTHAYN